MFYDDVLRIHFPQLSPTILPTIDTKDLTFCLSLCPVAVKEHHDHSSYKGKHLIGAYLQFQIFSLLVVCRHVVLEE